MTASDPPHDLVDETQAFQAARTPEALAEMALAPGEGAWADVAGPSGADLDATSTRAAERAGGLVRPVPQLGWWSNPVRVCRVAGARYLPRYGLVTDGREGVFAAPAGGLATAPGPFAAALAQSLGPCPAVWARPATVFMPWGAGFNYGHFLLDALPSLLAVERAGLLDRAPPLAPPLRAWQRDLLSMAGPSGMEIAETRAEMVDLPEAVFASSMDHFLHAPNALLNELRERVLHASPPPRRRAVGRRVYLSRRSHALPMRVMVNEAALERALAARGFVIVRPERLSPRRQIALVRGAEVIVGASGAAMANALFAPAGALLVEIQPEVFTSTWLAAMADIVGLDWRIYYTPAPVAPERASRLRRLRRGFRFAYETPLNDFLGFLDRRLI